MQSVASVGAGLIYGLYHYIEPQSLMAIMMFACKSDDYEADGELIAQYGEKRRSVVDQTPPMVALSRRRQLSRASALTGGDFPRQAWRCRHVTRGEYHYPAWKLLSPEMHTDAQIKGLATALNSYDEILELYPTRFTRLPRLWCRCCTSLFVNRRPTDVDPKWR